MSRSVGRIAARIALVAVLLGGIGFALATGWSASDLLALLAEHSVELNQWVQANQTAAVAAYMAIYLVGVTLSLPGAVWLTVIGGYVFGTAPAAFYTVAVATLGATILFLLARTALRDWVESRAGGIAQRMEAGFHRNAFHYMLFLRLVPVFPFWLVNLVPALLGVRLSVYVIATFVGIVPGTVVFASLGNGLGEVIEAGGVPDASFLAQPDILMPLVGLAVLALVPVMWRRFRKEGAKHG